VIHTAVLSPSKPITRRHEVVIDANYGYRRLDPMPEESEFQRFY